MGYSHAAIPPYIKDVTEQEFRYAECAFEQATHDSVLTTRDAYGFVSFMPTVVGRVVGALGALSLYQYTARTAPTAADRRMTLAERTLRDAPVSSVRGWSHRPTRVGSGGAGWKAAVFGTLGAVWAGGEAGQLWSEWRTRRSPGYAERKAALDELQRKVGAEIEAHRLAAKEAEVAAEWGAAMEKEKQVQADIAPPPPPLPVPVQERPLPSLAHSSDTVPVASLTNRADTVPIPSLPNLADTHPDPPTPPTFTATNANEALYAAADAARARICRIPGFGRASRQDEMQPPPGGVDAEGIGGELARTLVFPPGGWAEAVAARDRAGAQVRFMEKVRGGASGTEPGRGGK